MNNLCSTLCGTMHFCTMKSVLIGDFFILLSGFIIGIYVAGWRIKKSAEAIARMSDHENVS